MSNPNSRPKCSVDELSCFSSTGRYKPLIVLSTFSSSLAFTLLIVRWRGHTNLFESLYIFPSGFGSGTCIAATFVGLNAGLNDSSTAIAGSGFYLSMNIGEITVMSISSAVLQACVKYLLRSSLHGRADAMKVSIVCAVIGEARQGRVI